MKLKRIILAALTSALLLGGAKIAFAECQTLAQARAANPTTYLSYRVVAGEHCWFAKDQRHRDPPVAEKRKAPPARSMSEEKPAATTAMQAPIDFRNTFELDTAERLSAPSDYAGRITGTFSAIGFGTRSVEIVESIILGRDADKVEIYPTPSADPPRQRGPPIETAAGYLKLAAWLLLTIGVGIIAAYILHRHGDRFQARVWRHFESWRRAQRMRVRDYPSERTPLVTYIAYLEQAESSADGPARHAALARVTRLTHWLRGRLAELWPDGHRRLAASIRNLVAR